MIRVLFSATLCFALVGCGAERQSPRMPSAAESMDDYPLQRPSVIAKDFLWHQQITATVDGKRIGFQAFVGKEGDTLTVIGLSPIGSSWFELVQRGLDVDYWSVVPDALPLPPRYVLGDIQRAYFPVSSDPSPQAGTRTVTLGGVEVTESWKDGELRERRFRDLHDGASGGVIVRYPPSAPGSREPRIVIVENARFGYVLEISTVDQATRSGERSRNDATPH